MEGVGLRLNVVAEVKVASWQQQGGGLMLLALIYIYIYIFFMGLLFSFETWGSSKLGIFFFFFLQAGFHDESDYGGLLVFWV